MRLIKRRPSGSSTPSTPTSPTKSASSINALPSRQSSPRKDPCVPLPDFQAVPLFRGPSDQSISSDPGIPRSTGVLRRATTKDKAADRRYPPSAFTGSWGLRRLKSFRGKQKELASEVTGDSGSGVLETPLSSHGAFGGASALGLKHELVGREPGQGRVGAVAGPSTSLTDLQPHFPSPSTSDESQTQSSSGFCRPCRQTGAQVPGGLDQMRSASADSTIAPQSIGSTEIRPLTPLTARAPISITPIAGTTAQSTVEPKEPSWALNRNASSSTSSSGLGPPTDESVSLNTPHGALVIPSNRDTFGLLLDVPRPSLSRASTLSFQEGDDAAFHRKGSDRALRPTAMAANAPSRQTSPDRISRQCQVMSVDPASHSPTRSFAASRATATPSVSSTSTVRGRGLRISTSNLDTSSTSADTQGGRAGRTSRTSSGTPVAFEQAANEADEDDDHDRQARVRNYSRPSRPYFGRMRSSSLGDSSAATTSVYSVGEVTAASLSVLSPARMVAFQSSSPSARRSLDEGRGPQGLVESILASSEAEPRAFQAEERTALAASRRIRGDAPAQERAGSTDPSRSRGYSARRAPPPPHLTLDAPPPASVQHPAVDDSVGVQGPGSGTVSSKRTAMPQRQTSLGRLWRKLSASAGGIPRENQSSSKSPVPPPIPRFSLPVSVRSSARRALSSSRTPIDRVVPDVSPPPLPLAPGLSDALERTGVSRSNKVSGDVAGKPLPPPPHQLSSSTLPLRPSLSPSAADPGVPSPRSTLPAVLPTNNDDEPRAQPSQSCLYVSPRRTRPFPQRPRSPVPPDTTTFRAPLGPFTPPIQLLIEDYFSTSPRKANIDEQDGDDISSVRGRRSLSGLTEADVRSHEVRRRYRQTLVEIEDDEVFHRVLEDLTRLERDGRAGRTAGGGIKLVDGAAVSGKANGVGSPAGSASDSGHFGASGAMITGDRRDELQEMASCGQGKRQGIQVWFVTRELVQGERRYGRLLAKGVSIVQAATDDRREFIPPLPTIPPILPSLTTPMARSSTFVPLRLQRARTNAKNHARSRSEHASLPASPTGSHLRLSLPPPPSLSTHQLPISSIPTFPTQPSATDGFDPFTLLRSHLPRLVALSLSLSNRFEHDPSPYGVADAFLSMRHELSEEFAEWAREMGNLVARGLGEILERETERLGGRRSKSTGEIAVLVEQDDRLALGDIIIMPIQRASRYRLLFRELVGKTTPNSNTRTKVEEALRAAEHLAEECDRRQDFPLDAIRRSTGTSASPTSLFQSDLQAVGGVSNTGSSKPRSRPISALPLLLPPGTIEVGKRKSRMRPVSMIVPSAGLSWFTEQ